MEPGSTPAVTITELEGSLTQITGVRAVRIVASNDGRIEEVHVLGLPGKAPKQLVRDIESTLQALYGIAIDRRKISVAQIGLAEEPAPAEPVEDAPPAEEPQVASRVVDDIPKRGTAARSDRLGRGLASLISDPAHRGDGATHSHPRRRYADVHPIGAPAPAEQRVRILGVEVDTDSLRTTVRVRLAIDRRKISIEQIGLAEEPAVAAEEAPAATTPEAEPAAPEGASIPPASPKNGGLGRGLASLIPSAGGHPRPDEPASHPRRRYADVHPIGAPAPAEQRIRIQGVEVDTDSLRTTVRVRLGSDDEQMTGEAVGPAGRATVLRLVGEATLKAVEKLGVSSGLYAVEDCSIATLGGRGVSVCSIVTVTSEGEQVLSGSAVVRHTAESATARATLDALNRRLGL